jgi:hypothetical protein
LTGRWREHSTPIESTCELEDPETFYLDITQSGDILQIEFSDGTTANAKIKNWNGEGPWEGPWEVTTEQQSTSDTAECNAFFADIEAWLGDLPALTSCVPTFCLETQKMKGTVMEDLETIRGTVDWVFEYRAICTYSGEDPFDYPISEKCVGVDSFEATKQ